MRKMLSSLVHSENTRQVLYAAFPITFFGSASIGLLTQAEHDWFSRLGSIIVAWALIMIALRRDKYERYLWRIERSRIIAQINKQVQMRDMMQESLALTFDIHALEIMQINEKIGNRGTFLQPRETTLQELETDISNRYTTAPWVSSSETLIEELAENETQYQSELKRFSSWSVFFLRLEILLVVWGTLQWGYGDLFATWARQVLQSLIQ